MVVSLTERRKVLHSVSVATCINYQNNNSLLYLFLGTYSVQNASFSPLPDASVMNVTCYFATNAFASACMAWFESTSLGLAFNGTVNHTHGSLNSSGNVTIPPKVLQHSGVSHIIFDVKVFDVDTNGNTAEKPAYEETVRVELNNAEPNPDTSTHATGDNYYTI